MYEWSDALAHLCHEQRSMRPMQDLMPSNPVTVNYRNMRNQEATPRKLPSVKQEIDVHKKRLQMISDIGSEHVQVIPKFGREEPLDKKLLRGATARCAKWPRNTI